MLAATIIATTFRTIAATSAAVLVTLLLGASARPAHAQTQAETQAQTQAPAQSQPAAQSPPSAGQAAGAGQSAPSSQGAPAAAASAPSAQAAGAPASPANEALWEGARKGDTAGITRALEQGAQVDARTRYGATALTFAAGGGHVDAVKLLLARGADINVQDTFYRMRPLDLALTNKHITVASLLLERGSKGAGSALTMGLQAGDEAVVKAALASADLTAANVQAALAVAKRTNNAALTALVAAKAAAMPLTTTPAVAVDRATLQSYVGRYRSEALGAIVTVTLNGDQLTAAMAGQQPITLIATSPTNFNVAELESLTIAFAGRGGMIERALLTQNNNTQAFERVAADAAAATGTGTAAGAPPASAPAATGAATGGSAAAGSTTNAANAPNTASAANTTGAAGASSAIAPAARSAARPWPAFRGDNAAGNGDGQGAVAQWDVKTGSNVRWKTPIPGLSNASPIVWGNRVFVVTAISSAGDKTFRTGLYGDVLPVADLSEHTWKIYCLDRANGRVIWERTAYTGLPKVKRHTKASQANSTPVTDGKRVVAIFGSIGLLAAWDMDGKPLWTVDVGVLDSGWFFDPAVQWGHSSSPIIYRDTVILQADVQKGSFLAAYHLQTGKQVWRTQRDEIATWGTPTLFRADGREQIVTNGPTIRGYDPATGKQLWTLGPNSEVTVGTPVVGDGLVYVTGGYPPVRPIYAIKPSAAGAITLSKEQAASEALAWSNDREGTYIPTPLFYGGILYTCGNNGIVTAYDGKTGERLYRARVGGGGAFSASPIAADGRLYFSNEDGEVYVAKAGRTYEELAKNQMDEVVMSTPAIADGVIVMRTLGHVYGIGEKAAGGPK